MYVYVSVCHAQQWQSIPYTALLFNVQFTMYNYNVHRTPQLIFDSLTHICPITDVWCMKPDADLQIPKCNKQFKLAMLKCWNDWPKMMRNWWGMTTLMASHWVASRALYTVLLYDHSCNVITLTLQRDWWLISTKAAKHLLDTVAATTGTAGFESHTSFWSLLLSHCLLLSLGLTMQPLHIANQL